MNDLNANLQNVNARIARACQQAGRARTEVSLLAVSKGHSAASVRALRAAGQLAFGENYVQEARAKQAELADPALEWHFIGPIQSNKTAEIARHFDWAQSVDREIILQRLSRQRPEELGALNVCLQVNIDREERKAGAAPESIPELARRAVALPGLRLRGLMAIPKPAAQNHDPAHSFRALKALFERLRVAGFALDTLSMGMSADLEQAIMEGSTMVRIGTDLFGRRD